VAALSASSLYRLRGLEVDVLIDDEAVQLVMMRGAGVPHQRRHETTRGAGLAGTDERVCVARAYLGLMRQGLKCAAEQP
jgi:hypothetical protein